MKRNDEKTLPSTWSLGNQPRCSKPHESRPGWAVCYPIRKRHSWMADFSGVVSLGKGERFWLNIWRNPTDFGIQLKAKDSAVPDIWRCRLQADPSGCYIGTLQLSNESYRVTVREDAGYIRVHFKREGGAE